MNFLRRIILLLSLLLLSSQAFADSFVVQQIRIEGLQGINQNTVMKNVPLKVGQTFTSAKGTQIITALYETGFFNNVALTRVGNALIIKVSERPVISSITVSGNKLITKDQIDKVLKSLGLVRGQVFNQSTLDEVVTSLEDEYYQEGHYNAYVVTNITPKSRQRVAVDIKISEGRVVLVKKIQITGNKVFSASDLINALTLTAPKWDSFVTHHDHYSAQDLNKSLQALSDYYLDRGYIHFKVDSAHAVLTPNREYVTLIIHVTEGAQYHFSGFDLSGQLILPKATFLALPAVKELKSGMVFSKSKLEAATKAMGDALGNVGYTFADIKTEPVVNEQNKTLFVHFVIRPGNRIYIRYVHFSGNTATSDSVLRSSMRQMEGEVASVKNIRESKRQINLLGFFQHVQENVTPVPNSPNQVDLDYKVTETPSAQATFGAGYSTDGVVLQAGVNESNFLGTGRSVGLNFNRSEYARTYSFNYNNPYYTADGVQRGFNVYNTETTPGAVNLEPYSFTTYGGMLTYSIPFSEEDSYQFGVGAQRTTLHLGDNPSIQVQSFAAAQGSAFNQTLLSFGLTRNDLDRAYLPTDGSYQQFNVSASGPLSGNALDYYTATYQAHLYQPLSESHEYIAGFSGALGYGNGYGRTQGLPFFVNYYAGGLGYDGAVRGYETNTLGPQDNQGNPMGGNALIAGSAEFIFPNPIDKDNVRTSVFVDSGDVYATRNVYNIGQQQVGINLGQLRYSTGFDIQWRLPILNAVLEVALAKALNPKPQDQTEPFSFNIGTSF